MAVTTFVEEIVLEKPKRTRKTHHKVKTGCQTCKIRRKKCGEEKPFCRRCTSTGRKCDGYGPEADPDAKPAASTSPDSGIDVTSVVATDAVPSSTSSPPTNTNTTTIDKTNKYLQLWRPPSTAWFSNDQDYFCFDFFRCRTGPEFAAYFDSSIWRTFIIRACFMNPTVLQAAAAVGAVHRRFELGISREAFEYCDIALKQYRKAVRCLQNDLNSGHPNGPEINMIVSILLSVFETFQGNEEAALTYMSTGIKQLVNRKFKTTHSESQYKIAHVNYASLKELFVRLEKRATKLFGTRLQILQHPGESLFMDDVPKTFENLAQARDVIFTEARWIWHLWTQLELGNIVGFSRQYNHVSRLLEWSMAYAEYSKTERCRASPGDRQAAHLLKVYREALYLVILTQIAFHEPDTGALIVPLCIPPETCDCHTSCRNYAERRSALNAHYARLLILSENIVDDESYFAYEEHSISLDSGIGPPLYLGTSKCRSTKVRHQVTNLLDKSDLQKKVWDTLGVYTIAEKLGSIEEHAVVAAGAIPSTLDPKWVDITCFLEESRILLRHCRQDDVYGGLVWTQEWITF